MITLCSQCGAPLSDSHKFCTKCGAARSLPAPGAARPRFCDHCGNPLEEPTKFCPKCGAVVADAGSAIPAPKAAPPVPVPVRAPSEVPPSPPPPKPVAAPLPTIASPVSGAPVATQPKKSGNLFLKIVVAILAFIAVISVLVIGSCFYIGYRIKKKADQVQQAYKKEDVGKIIGALGQDKSGSSSDLGKILGALGQAPAQGGSGAEETVQEQPCPAVDPSQSKTFRDAAASASIPLVPGLTLTAVWTNRKLGGRDVEDLYTMQGIDNNT
ncbi:MAG TPA: zinc ribbon domain-containing protein, partial [Terriglobia bacterium]|nr:zinc ribbon domain-containing protein [Terriglobia bacterium]